MTALFNTMHCRIAIHTALLDTIYALNVLDLWLLWLFWNAPSFKAVNTFYCKCRHISNVYRAPLSNCHKKAASIDIGRAAFMSEEDKGKMEVAADKWFSTYGDMYSKRHDAPKPPVPKVSM